VGRGLGVLSRLGIAFRLMVGIGVGRKEVVLVGGDGGVDGFAPAGGAEGVDVFVLGDVDGLKEGLEHVGYGAGQAGFDFAADNGGDETGEGGVEIAGGEVVAGEEVGEVLA